MFSAHKIDDGNQGQLAADRKSGMVPAADAADVPVIDWRSSHFAAEDARTLGLSIFQFVGSSLEGGPQGIHPPTHIAGVSAIAGYAAKHLMSLKVSRGDAEDDFELVKLSRLRTAVVSEQVNQLVLAMDRPSVASISIDAAMRSGLSRIPDTNQLLYRHLADSNAHSDTYSHDGSDVPPETLLMMHWEPVARFFRSSPAKFEISPFAAAHAMGEAISAYRESCPVDTSLQLALNTAIAMSKTDRVF